MVSIAYNIRINDIQKVKMIKKINKKCVECGREDQPWYSKKRCKSCATKSYGSISSTPNPIKAITAKTAKKKKEQSSVRQVYFDYHTKQCTRSEESGKGIAEANRANIAHLFDKGRHKSVQANLDNYVYLTLQEHTDFDKHLFRLDFQALKENFPNSWKIACGRLKKLIPLVEERTKFYFAIKKYIDGK